MSLLVKTPLLLYPNPLYLTPATIYYTHTIPPPPFPVTPGNLLGDKKNLTTFRKEIEQILQIWKFIKLQIVELKTKYSVSCRLLLRLSKNTVRYYIADFPSWLKRIYLKWFNNLSPSIC